MSSTRFLMNKRNLNLNSDQSFKFSRLQIQTFNARFQYLTQELQPTKYWGSIPSPILVIVHPVALTFCCWSFFEYLLIVFGGATPIFADLKDSKRLLMVLWKISCTSFSSLLTSKWLRLYLCRCCKPENKRQGWKRIWEFIICKTKRTGRHPESLLS